MTGLLQSLADFHFLRPWWLLGIVAVIIVVLFLRRHQQSFGQWNQVIAKELLPFLMEKGSGKSIDLKPWLLISGIILSVSLAGPSWYKKEVQIHKQTQALVVLFDLSPSMMAADLKPDRLTRARLKAIDLLNNYKEGSSALIALRPETP